MKSFYLTVALVLATTGTILAADDVAAIPAATAGIVEGEVVDEGGGVPVAWAWIVLTALDDSTANSGKSGSAHQAISSRDGSFVIGSMAPGRYEVTVSHVGYVTPDAEVLRVEPGGRARIRFRLVPRIHTQPPIIVSAASAPVPENQLEKTLSHEILPRRGGVLNDPLRALAAAPGAETRSDFDGRVAIRGASPFETGFALDGIPVPFAYHLGGAVSIFDAEAVEEIRFYTGGHPASHGPGSSGVVSVTTRSGGGPPRRRIELSPVALSGSVRQRGFGDRLSAFASLRATYHDLVLRALEVQPGVTVPNFYDGRLNLGWRIDDHQNIGLRLLRSGDAMRMGLFADGDNEVQITGDLTRAAALWDGAWPIGSGVTGGGKVAVAYQPFEYDMRVRGADNESMDWDATTTFVRVDAFVERGKHRLQVGWLRGFQTLNYSVNMARGFWSAWSGTQGETTIAADPVTLVTRGAKDAGSESAFVQDRWSFGSHWAVTAGLRMDRFNASDEQFFDPRACIEWSDDQYAVYAAGGVYHAHPLESVGDPTSLGDAITARRSVHKILGVRRSLGRWGVMNGEIFERRTTRVVSEVEPGQSESVGKGWAAGTELTWSKTAPVWDAEAAYSFGRSELWDPHGPVVKTAEPAGDGGYRPALTNGPDAWYTSPFDPGHGLRLHAAGRPTRNTYIGVTWRFRSGAPYTPVAGIVVDDRGKPFGIDGTVGSARLPAYHRLDLRVERSWKNGWGSWSAFLDVTNVYNRANVFQASYDKGYTERTEYRMLPVVPSVGIALEF